MTEIAPIPPPKEHPHPQVAAKEKPQAAPPFESKPAHAAHTALEQIARGVPVAEATEIISENAAAAKSVSSTETSASTNTEVTTRTKESLPNKEAIDHLLTETNALLLELRDMRLVLSALATQAADTPLGNEMRLDALRMVSKMSNADMPPDAVIKLDALQKQITDLKLPEPDPEQSALLPIIATYNEAHPDKAVPAEVIHQIKSGSRDAGSTIAQLLQTNADLAQPVWKELTGVDGFTGLHPTPENILQLAGIETTTENLSKAHEIFGRIQHMSPEEQVAFMDVLMPLFMKGALVLMFFMPLMTGQNEGGGH